MTTYGGRGSQAGTGRVDSLIGGTRTSIPDVSHIDHNDPLVDIWRYWKPGHRKCNE